MFLEQYCKTNLKNLSEPFVNHPIETIPSRYPETYLLLYGFVLNHDHHFTRR